MTSKLLSVLLIIVIITCALPITALADIEPPTALGAPEHFGASHYYVDQLYFTFSTPEDLRNYIEKRAADDPDNKQSFSVNFQVDYKINSGSWHYTSAWDSPKTVPNGLKNFSASFRNGKDYSFSERWGMSSIFKEDDALKSFNESGWDYLKENSITLRARFTQSFDGGKTFVISPWSKEFILSANAKADYNKLIDHAPALTSVDLKTKGEKPYFYIKLEKAPGEVQDLHAMSGSVRTEIWMRRAGDKDFKYIHFEWCGQEYSEIDARDYFEDKKQSYEEESYEIKTRYALDLRKYKQSGIDSTTSVDIYGPFSNVISHNMPAWSEASSWATEELKKADEYGIIPDSLKGADMTKPITREEFAELAVKLYEKTMGTATIPVSPNPFKDTTNPEILKAFRVGVTTGTSATTFAPKELTNREQVATMLSRAIRVMAPRADFSTVGAPTFTDQKDISSWALEHVKFMSKNEIIKGSNGKFMPKATTTAEKASGYATTTREMAIAMSVRSFDKFKAVSTPPQKVTTPTPINSQNTNLVGAASGMPKDDKGIAGLWLGTYFPYDGLGIRWRWMTFFEDGTLYFDLPSKGFIGFDRSESKKTHEDFWGTYTFSGGAGIWKYNSETGNGSEMTIADDGGLDTGGYGRFYRCVSVDGLKLDGAYTSYSDPTDPDLKKEGTKPVIRFKADGSFVDEGLYMVLDPIIENEAQRAPGGGTYEIKDFSLILHYSDGRTKQAGLTLGYKGSVEESPSYIYMYLRLMTRMP